MRLLVMMTVITTAAILSQGCGKKEEPAPKEVVRPVKVVNVQGSGGGVNLTYPGKTRANDDDMLFHPQILLAHLSRGVEKWHFKYY